MATVDFQDLFDQFVLYSSTKIQSSSDENYCAENNSLGLLPEFEQVCESNSRENNPSERIHCGENNIGLTMNAATTTTTNTTEKVDVNGSNNNNNGNENNGTNNNNKESGNIVIPTENNNNSSWQVVGEKRKDIFSESCGDNGNNNGMEPPNKKFATTINILETMQVTRNININTNLGLCPTTLEDRNETTIVAEDSSHLMEQPSTMIINAKSGSRSGLKCNDTRGPMTTYDEPDQSLIPCEINSLQNTTPIMNPEEITHCIIVQKEPPEPYFHYSHYPQPPLPPSNSSAEEFRRLLSNPPLATPAIRSYHHHHQQSHLYHQQQLIHQQQQPIMGHHSLYNPGNHHHHHGSTHLHHYLGNNNNSQGGPPPPHWNNSAVSTTYHHYGNGMSSGAPMVHHISPIEPPMYYQHGDEQTTTGMNNSTQQMTNSAANSSMGENMGDHNNEYILSSSGNHDDNNGFGSSNNSTAGNVGTVVPIVSPPVSSSSNSNENTNAGGKGWTNNVGGNENTGGNNGSSSNMGDNNSMFPGGLEVLWKEVPEECQKLITLKDVPDAAKFRGYFTVCELLALKRSLTARLKKQKPGGIGGIVKSALDSLEPESEPMCLEPQNNMEPYVDTVDNTITTTAVVIENVNNTTAATSTTATTSETSSGKSNSRIVKSSAYNNTFSTSSATNKANSSGPPPYRTATLVFKLLQIGNYCFRSFSDVNPNRLRVLFNTQRVVYECQLPLVKPLKPGAPLLRKVLTIDFGFEQIDLLKFGSDRLLIRVIGAPLLTVSYNSANDDYSTTALSVQEQELLEQIDKGQLKLSPCHQLYFLNERLVHLLESQVKEHHRLKNFLVT